MKALEVIIKLINENGTLLIIDIKKCDQDCPYCAVARSPGSPHEGRKITGHGRKDVVKALEVLGIEDIALIADRVFLFEAKHGTGPNAPTMRRKENYLVLKAKRGEVFEKRLFERSEEAL